MQKLTSVVCSAILFFGIAISGQAQNSKPDWQKHIDWAANDTGAPDCPWLYSQNLECLGIGAITGNNGGNRSCLITEAIIAAKGGYDQAAYGLTLITQCHNPGAAQSIAIAGPTAVANYLRTFE
jgi:hypothetical protein